MYIAVKYIGTDYTPGEVLPDGLDEAFIQRLLRVGAIRRVAPAQAEKPAPAAPLAPPADTGDGEDTEDTTDEDTEDTTDEDAEDTTDEDAEDDVEPEAPEVDVADALVAPAEPEETEKPARSKRGTTKKGGRAK